MIKAMPNVHIHVCVSISVTVSVRLISILISVSESESLSVSMSAYLCMCICMFISCAKILSGRRAHRRIQSHVGRAHHRIQSCRDVGGTSEDLIPEGGGTSEDQTSWLVGGVGGGHTRWPLQFKYIGEIKFMFRTAVGYEKGCEGRIVMVK
jgi:hypothetical protein